MELAASQLGSNTSAANASSPDVAAVSCGRSRATLVTPVWSAFPTTRRDSDSTIDGAAHAWHAVRQSGQQQRNTRSSPTPAHGLRAYQDNFWVTLSKKWLFENSINGRLERTLKAAPSAQGVWRWDGSVRNRGGEGRDPPALAGASRSVRVRTGEGAEGHALPWAALCPIRVRVTGGSTLPCGAAGCGCKRYPPTLIPPRYPRSSL